MANQKLIDESVSYANKKAHDFWIDETEKGKTYDGLTGWMAAFALSFAAQHAATAVAEREREIADKLVFAHSRTHCIGRRGVGLCGVCGLIESLEHQAKQPEEEKNADR